MTFHYIVVARLWGFARSSTRASVKSLGCRWQFQFIQHKVFSGLKSCLKPRVHKPRFVHRGIIRAGLDPLDPLKGNYNSAACKDYTVVCFYHYGNNLWKSHLWVCRSGVHKFMTIKCVSLYLDSFTDCQQLHLKTVLIIFYLTSAKRNSLY